jgi:siroheme synthase
MGTDGVVSGSLEIMTRQKYLAWAIGSRSVNPQRSTKARQQNPQHRLEEGEAGRLLVRFIDRQEHVSELMSGDPFRFQEAINQIQGNFVAI